MVVCSTGALLITVTSGSTGKKTRDGQSRHIIRTCDTWWYVVLVSRCTGAIGDEGRAGGRGCKTWSRHWNHKSPGTAGNLDRFLVKNIAEFLQTSTARANKRTINPLPPTHESYIVFYAHRCTPCTPHTHNDDGHGDKVRSKFFPRRNTFTTNCTY